MLTEINKEKSMGIDKMHPFLLSVAAFEIYKPLTHIINLSILNGKFPDILKIAKVIPIFKQGSRTLCNNYRPISILPALSKLFEKCIFVQLNSYLISRKLLVPNQYGFRPGSKTTDCLIDLVDEISSHLDKSNYVLTLFLDLSKAFDTVNHSILLSKMDFYGIQDLENHWFKSYLQKRKQRVFVNGVLSKTLPVNSGVPQGSILGPLLFLIYINDVTNATSYFNIRLFADDTSLTVSGHDLDFLIQKVNMEFQKILDWLSSNKLTLNLSKTKYIIFQPRQKVNYNLYPPVMLADQVIEQTHNFKYLGVIMDSNLSWHDHIDYISDKISKSINIMTKIKRHLGTKPLLSIYYSLVYPYLTYGCPLWGNNYSSPLDRIVKLQNRALRIINNVPLHDHISPHYIDLRLLKFTDIVKLHTNLFFMKTFITAIPTNTIFLTWLTNIITLLEAQQTNRFR